MLKHTIEEPQEIDDDPLRDLTPDERLAFEAAEAAHRAAMEGERLEKLERADAERKAKSREAFLKRMAEGKAKGSDPDLRHGRVYRPDDASGDNLHFFPAHIAAHAILASVLGFSNDGLLDNEFSRNSDGSVRCSIKLKSGGHSRFDVVVPDEVKLSVVEVAEKEAA